MSTTRYSFTAIILHWAIAFLLLFQLALGWHMTSMGQGAAAYAAFQFHKSIGMTVLALSLMRVAVRFVKPRPAPVETGAMGVLVKLVHVALYGFMIGGPLTGWAIVSTSNMAIPTRLFTVIPLPHLPLDHAWNEIVSTGHAVIGWVGAGLILVHVAGAIRHHLGGGQENVIGRMIPGVTMRRAIPAGLAAVAVLGAAFIAPWLIYRNAPQAPVAAQSAPQAPVADMANATAPDVDAIEPALNESAAVNDAAPAEAVAPARWTVQPGGRLGFTASMNGEAIEGRFEKWTADVVFDPEALSDSSITVRVPLLSADTDNSERDTMLKGEDFFGNAGNATFRSDRIQHRGGERYTAAGSLSMNGVSRPMTLSFTLNINGDRASVAGSAKLDRTAFNIGKGMWATTDQIAGTVDVAFKFTAKKKP